MRSGVRHAVALHVGLAQTGLLPAPASWRAGTAPTPTLRT